MKKWVSVFFACITLLSMPVFVCAQEAYLTDDLSVYLAECSTEELLEFQDLLRMELLRRKYDDQIEQTWIVNINTDKFHRLTCKSVKTIKEKNRFDYTGSRELLIMLGFEPCSRCQP